MNELSIFGENTGAGIIVISATSKRIGTMIHANDDLEQILGFKKSDIIGKNISFIMPRPIGRVHDRFIQRYFETAKATVIDINRELFTSKKDGYIKPIRLVVKVYPELSNKLVFVGFI